MTYFHDSGEQHGGLHTGHESFLRTHRLVLHTLCMYVCINVVCMYVFLCTSGLAEIFCTRSTSRSMGPMTSLFTSEEKKYVPNYGVYMYICILLKYRKAGIQISACFES